MDRRLDAGSAAPVAIALSGGSDSLALLRLAQAWTARRGRRLLALTVDHGLHPDSAAWTAAAGRTARSHGAEWRPLAWTGDKPAAGLPAAARAARHALLAEAARGEGARVLLLGHTADDVAESDWMRARTPTHGGLQEWTPSPAWPQGRELFLLRPLLRLRRCALQAWLRQGGIGWLDDPANRDPRFARTRARAAVAGAAGAGIAPVTRPDAPTLDDLAEADAWGALTLDRRRLLASAEPAGHLGRALLCAAGQARPPARAALERLLARLQMREALAATLAGARLRTDGEALHLTREAGRRGCVGVALESGTPCVFDGRFELVAQAPGWRTAALAGHAAALTPSDQTALRAAPPDVRPTLPVLLDRDGRAALPEPFGGGPAMARSLVGPRLRASLGLIGREGER